VLKACELSSFILEKSLARGFDCFLSNAYRDRAYCTAKMGYVDSTKIFLDLSEEWRSKTPKINASPGYYYYMYKVSMIISDYDRALRYLEISANQEKQINRNNRSSELNDARAEFDYLLQKARINELKSQNEATEEKSKRRRTTIMGIAAILLISIVAFLNSKKQYKNLNYSYKTLVKKHVEVDSLNNQLIKEKSKKEIKRSNVFIKDEDKILEKLLNLLNNEKIYIDPDLSLVSMAEKLETNTSYLSTIINKHFNINFKSLINKYRIDEARKILVSEQGAGYSIEGIASEVGFQSRSVFYQTFRQITGLTPTAYVKSYKSICPDS
jgi:YesN/AraC family two-component response regulator